MPHRLLFVEDNEAQRSSFRDAVRDWNAKNADRIFQLETANRYDDALRKLAAERFDGALLDLRLPGGETPLSGEDLADTCVSEYGIPAAIISGDPAGFDESKADGMLKVFNKGDTDAYDRAVEWFGSLYHMMKVMAGTKRNIERHGAIAFLKQVWPRWREYERLTGINDAILIGIVSRQYASHIAEILGLDNEENILWHPFENYIKPALRERRPHTGDIFKLEDRLWIILTPQCDMATGKATSVLLAACDHRPPLKEWQVHVAAARDPSGSAGKKDKAERFFRALVNQDEPALHFLPPLEGDQPLMVNFKDLRTVALEEVTQKLSVRIASVAPPFLGNLTQRFGSYISRMGQPNIDTSHFK